MENLTNYTEYEINESRKTYYENKIEVLRKEIKQSRNRLTKNIQKLKHSNQDYVSRLRKQIVDLQTQIRKLD
jgi:seryl-tRNA synthetase